MTEPGGAGSGSNGPLVFLVAGEPSGDVLGGRLMAAMKRRAGGETRFAGVGGPSMEAEGLESLFPMRELSLFGITEIVPHLRSLRRRLRETEAEFRRLRPDALVTIDSPGFCFTLARRLRDSDAPRIHYVAPTVWAWRPGRARKIARYLDHLLLLFPFEPPYFDAVGLANTVVGPPVLEADAAGDGAAFRVRHAIPEAAPMLCVLPGSRRSETDRLLPVFGATVALLRRDHPDLHVVVPTVPAVADTVANAVADWAAPTVLCAPEEKWDAFAACRAALAASGTVTLELAHAGLPMVVAYRVSPFTTLVALIMVRTRMMSLVNILLGRMAVPEMVLRHCRPAPLAREVNMLLGETPARRAQLAAFGEISEVFAGIGAPPSERAAETVLSLIAARGTRTAVKAPA
ncbi:MAG: lipid-A-disaccharide synthase [Alphaproteobacteria bacterium]